MTEQEKKYGNDLIGFYSTSINKNKEKVSDFIYADDKVKLEMISEFLTDIVSPIKSAELSVYRAKVSELSADINSLSAYTK